MCALYAFMRIADDLADGPGTVRGEALPPRRLAAPPRRRAAPAPTAIRFTPHCTTPSAATASRREYLDAVLDGVEMDLDAAHYDTFADLYPLLLPRGVGGRAGVHSHLGLHRREGEGARRGGRHRLPADEHPARPGEDAGRGRVYLPREDLERFGYGEDDLRAGVRDDRFRAPDALRGGARRGVLPRRPSRWRRCCDRPAGRCSW